MFPRGSPGSAACGHRLESRSPGCPLMRSRLLAPHCLPPGAEQRCAGLHLLACACTCCLLGCRRFATPNPNCSTLVPRVRAGGARQRGRGDQREGPAGAARAAAEGPRPRAGAPPAPPPQPPPPKKVDHRKKRTFRPPSFSPPPLPVACWVPGATPQLPALQGADLAASVHPGPLVVRLARLRRHRVCSQGGTGASWGVHQRRPLTAVPGQRDPLALLCMLRSEAVPHPLMTPLAPAPPPPSWQVLDRNVENLSGGELQRFAIAVVAAQEGEPWAAALAAARCRASRVQPAAGLLCRHLAHAAKLACRAALQPMACQPWPCVHTSAPATALPSVLVLPSPPARKFHYPLRSQFVLSIFNPSLAADVYMIDEPSSYLDVRQRLKAAEVGQGWVG